MEKNQFHTAHKILVVVTEHVGNKGISIGFFRLGSMEDDHGEGRKVRRMIREDYQRTLRGKEIRQWEIQTVIF